MDNQTTPQAAGGDMPDENGRVTLAVIGIKLDNLQNTVDEIRTTTRQDHDRIGALESQMTDLVAIKRWLIGGAVILIGALITGVVILLQSISITHP